MTFGIVLMCMVTWLLSFWHFEFVWKFGVFWQIRLFWRIWPHVFWQFWPFWQLRVLWWLYPILMIFRQIQSFWQFFLAWRCRVSGSFYFCATTSRNWDKNCKVLSFKLKKFLAAKSFWCPRSWQRDYCINTGCTMFWHRQTKQTNGSTYTYLLIEPPNWQ